jgi:GT2 family glycosyltransferase
MTRHEYPSVSVIAPVFNAERGLPRLMESLRRQDYPRERVEVLLVDNNSTDRSAEVIGGYPEATPLRFTAWQSSYAARNVGIERARGDVLAFIDADCWACPWWLSAGVAALVEGRHDRVAGRVEFVLSRRPNIYEMYDSALNFRQGDFVGRGWSGAGNLFVWRRVMEEVGPWDPHLISQGDTEFGLRATRLGKTLGYAPDALICHHARRSLMSLVRKWIRCECGAAQVYRRHGLLGLHLWTRKANYRPLWGTWQDFPPHLVASPRARLAVDGISNILRLAGNLGSLIGCLRRIPGEG